MCVHREGCSGVINMCEVTRSSLEQLFPLIEKTIKEADFIAIDSEFTGLTVRENDKPSLFDSSEERYRKLRNNVSRLSLIQIGVSAFVKDRADNVYRAHTYNFPLCPAAFGTLDPSFVWQASSLEFLCRFNFDFNRSMYEGVSFLNDAQEKQLCQSLDSGVLFSGLERQFDESFIQSLCSKVAEWYVSSKEGEIFTLHKTNTYAKLWNDYVIHTEIRRRFPGVWTVTDSFKNVAVERVSEARRRELEEKDKVNQEQEREKLKKSMLGFTRVFRVIREYQKPIVGHNMLMDLLFMYDKFFHTLPAKYSTFKRNLNHLFPQIYDTKHISFHMKKVLQDITGIFSSNLIQLYHLTSSERVTNSVLFMPSVTHAKGFERYQTHNAPHEAGFDAYLCGYVFIRLIHLERFRNNKTTQTKNFPFQQVLSTASPFCNHINMIRAMVNSIILDGKDPPSQRPQLLFVRCRKRGNKLNRQKLAEWMSPHGTVDVQLLSASTALVAAGNFPCARAILSTFKGHRIIAVSKYQFWRHSAVARTLMWCGLLASGGVCVWAVTSIIRETSH